MKKYKSKAKRLLCVFVLAVTLISSVMPAMAYEKPNVLPEFLENTIDEANTNIKEDVDLEAEDTKVSNEDSFTWRETTAERNAFFALPEEEIGKHYHNETFEEILQMYNDSSIQMVDTESFFANTIG